MSAPSFTPDSSSSLVRHISPENPFDEDHMPEEIVKVIASFMNKETRIKFDRTCRRFHKISSSAGFFRAMENLIRFFLTRPCTQGERERVVRKLSEYPVVYGEDNLLGVEELIEIPILDHTRSLEVERCTEQKSQEFYQAFVKRSNDFNWGSCTENYMRGLSKALIYIYNNYSPYYHEYKFAGEFRSDMLSERLSQRAVDLFIKNFSAQNVNDITIESFKSTIEFSLMTHIRGDQREEIETKMRQAIKQKHSTAELDTIRVKLEEAAGAPDSPIFLAVQGSIIESLNKKKAELEEELFKLRGPTGFNGTIHSSFEEIQKQEAKLLEAKKIFAGEWAQMFEKKKSELLRPSFFDPKAELPGFSYEEFNTVSRETEYTFHFLRSLETMHRDLVRQLATIAEFNRSGEIVGGRLFEIEIDLLPMNVQERTRAEILRQADFYAELSQEVGDNDADVRSEALHAIIYQ